MFKRFFLASTAISGFAAVLFPTSSIAADLPPPPPPVVEIRQSVHDWTGPYIGGVVGAVCMEAYDRAETLSDGDMNGCGLKGGIVGGYNYQIDNVVVGVEGDWTFGQETARNSAFQEKFDIDWQSSLRGRAGWLANDETLFYATGGISVLRGTVNALIGAARTPRDDSKTHIGYIVGGGVEYAFTGNLHGRLEYLYSSYGDKTYDLNVAGVCGVPCEAEMDLEAVHSMRVGLTWNFNSYSW